MLREQLNEWGAIGPTFRLWHPVLESPAHRRSRAARRAALMEASILDASAAGELSALSNQYHEAVRTGDLPTIERMGKELSARA